MDDTDALRRRTARHEAGHSLMSFLLTKEAGALEVKWLSPGSGSCFPVWPKHWPMDDEMKVWVFCGLVDIAGLTAAQLEDPYVSPESSRKDLDNLTTAARELAALCGHAADPGLWRRGLTDMAKHLLAPHGAALDTLASLPMRRELWLSGDVTCQLYQWHPAYKHHVPLLEGEDWWSRIETVLDEMVRDAAAQRRKHEALQARIERRIAEYEARQASGLETKAGYRRGW